MKNYDFPEVYIEILKGALTGYKTRAIRVGNDYDVDTPFGIICYTSKQVRVIESIERR